MGKISQKKILFLFIFILLIIKLKCKLVNSWSQKSSSNLITMGVNYITAIKSGSVFGEVV
jgi:hypothetical protein